MTEMRPSGSGAAVASTPQLAHISPAESPPAGGMKVTITGTGLTDVVKVKFREEYATNLNIIDATRLTCVVPPNSPGRARVIAITRTNRESNPMDFDYS